MSHSWGPSWSNKPYAPQIPLKLYVDEKSNFAGFIVGSVLYGIVVIVFFQCMGTLLDPVNRSREGIRWGLVVHTVAMFSCFTINTALSLDYQSIAYIDNRAFPGDASLPPGPYTYQYLISSGAINVVSGSMFLLNNWLADGLLLYRCCVIYAMNYWVIAFPSLMYLATFALGIITIYDSSHLASGIQTSVSVKISTAYYSVSLALNVLLTLMIVIRLARHSRNIRKAMGTVDGASGLYSTLITMLVESYALYAVSFIVFIALFNTTSPAQDIFSQILTGTQVIAPLLITLRVAGRSALTSEAIVSGSLHFQSQGESASGSDTLADGDLTSPAETNERRTKKLLESTALGPRIPPEQLNCYRPQGNSP